MLCLAKGRQAGLGDVLPLSLSSRARLMDRLSDPASESKRRLAIKTPRQLWQFFVNHRSCVRAAASMFVEVLRALVASAAGRRLHGNLSARLQPALLRGW